MIYNLHRVWGDVSFHAEPSFGRSIFFKRSVWRESSPNASQPGIDLNAPHPSIALLISAI